MLKTLLTPSPRSPSKLDLEAPKQRALYSDALETSGKFVVISQAYAYPTTALTSANLLAVIRAQRVGRPNPISLPYESDTTFSTDIGQPLFQIHPARPRPFHRGYSPPHALSKEWAPLRHAPAAPYPRPLLSIET